jgi:hypothetical protein
MYLARTIKISFLYNSLVTGTNNIDGINIEWPAAPFKPSHNREFLSMAMWPDAGLKNEILFHNLMQ